MDQQHCSNRACGGLIEDGFCNRCGIEPNSSITSSYTPAVSGTYRANPTGTATLSRTQPPVWNSQTGTVGSLGTGHSTRRGTEGYIVMEYVGGQTLKTIRKERGPLPVTEAIAYIHRILGAFAYLHRHAPTLVYCDFKPDNFMIEADDVKLIDMGGVRLVDDPGGDIYGTRSYSAPEAGDGPTIVTDLYTVARTLVVLIIDFRGYQNSYEFTLPSPEEQPVFAKHESLYRFLLKATRKDPDERFQSADEMASQLAGVLREIVAIETATPRPSDSALFGGESPAGQDGSTPAGAALLPALKVDASDPAAQYILSNVGNTKDKRLGIYSLAVARFPKSIEAKLRLANSQIECGDFHKADNLLTELEMADPFDWRVTWTRALAQFTLGNASAAAALFNLIYSELPGELAPKLALALAADVAGEKAAAIQFYDMVSLADPNFTSAIFGLGRCLAETGFRPESIAAYARVPASSSAYTRAQIATARTWLLSTSAGDPTPEDIHRAWETIEALALDSLQHHQLVLEILQKALAIIEAGTVTKGSPLRIFGKSLYPGPLRKGMEEALRTIARLEENPDERINLIDLANQVRPPSLV